MRDKGKDLFINPTENGFISEEGEESCFSQGLEKAANVCS